MAFTIPDNLTGSTPRKMTDREALDEMVVYMGAQESWSGADVCEIVANLLGDTGRPHPGDDNNLLMYRQFADRYAVRHDGD